MGTDLSERLKHLPAKPGAYMMKDEHGKVIYVGKASSLRSRVRSYFQKGQTHSPKVQALVEKIHDVEWIVVESEVEALMLECNLIKKYRPRYNVRLRDDKHYPYLCVTTSEPFPRLIVTRRVKQDGNRYFGPFADTSAMRDSVRLIRRVFRIRSCNKKLTGAEHDRPCLNYHMGQCDAPCAGKISKEDYGALVADAIMFLEGRRESVAERLQQEMMEASERLEFERAAKLRDQVESIQRTIERQKAISTDMTDQDVIAVSTDALSACVQVLTIRSGRLLGEEHYFLEGVADEKPQDILGEFVKQYYRDATYIPREILVSHELEDAGIIEVWLTATRGSKARLTYPQRGDKMKLTEMATENAASALERERTRFYSAKDEGEQDLEALREVLDLPDIPMRIETYDISNIQGKEAVGSMVVFENGVPAKSEYRRFKIRTSDQPDDYGMMREVITRRLAAAGDDPKFSTLPDLMVIDGGRGQLNVAVDVVSHSYYEIRVISLAKRLEEIYTPDRTDPILLPRESQALRLMQRMRDEAHRFALAYHHKLREKAVKTSVLDSIPGIGDQRRKALIRKFGSVAGVRRASLEELSAVPGMTKSAAEAVLDRLNP